MHNNFHKGFSLIEVLLVVAILALIGSVSVEYYRSTAVYIQTKSFANGLISDMQYARSRSLNGENTLKWGVHVVNSTNDYYEVFSTPTDYLDATKIVYSTTTAPGGVTFSDPTSGATRDIIFSRIAGTTTATSVSVLGDGNTIVDTITALGVIY